MTICENCGRKYEYNRAKGHRLKKCNTCHIGTRRKKIKLIAIEYLGSSCKKCGYNKCIEALEFHHRDKNVKEISISKMGSYSIERIKLELNKCDLLCANCHREAHFGDSLLEKRQVEAPET